MVKFLLYSLLLSAIFSLNSSVFAQSLPKLRQQMTYETARKLLIESGWQAVFNLGQVNNSDRGVIIDYLINQKGYTEIVDCSGTGLGLCLFEFRNATGQTLLITTANNSPEEESVVFGWELKDGSSQDDDRSSDSTASKVDAICKVTDPTGTPLNVRDRPNGKVINALKNGRDVYIEETAYDRQGRPWARVSGDRNGKYRLWGWVFREFISCYER